jgi:hypothetical protein
MGSRRRHDPPSLSEQLRQAALRLGMTAAGLARATGESENLCRRFLELPDSGHWVSTLDAIGRHLGARLIVDNPRPCSRRRSLTPVKSLTR